jgi:hypothetical protein
VFQIKSKSGLTLDDAWAQITLLLEGIRRDVQSLRRSDPPPAQISMPYRYYLSDNGKTQIQIPIAFNITGLMIGGDTAGQGVLTIGTEQQYFWIPANQTQYYPFSLEDRIGLKNDSVAFTPPGGTTHWNVILIGHAGKDA